MQSIIHIPVLEMEVLSALQVERGGKYIDCTLGAGGHAKAILERCQSKCKLLGIDADPKALAVAEDNLTPFHKSYVLVEGNFNELESIARQHDFLEAQGILFDLGLSSLQLHEQDERGFSFRSGKPLDMRLNPEQKITASTIINFASEEELISLFKNYGEEKSPKRIARVIVNNRPFLSAADLAKTIEKAAGRRERIHPATRIFQAIRIEVNNELDNLKLALGQVINVLSAGGRLVVIAYHSLEDRIVKEFMKLESRNCICSPYIPVCNCNHQSTLRIISRKVIKPGRSEILSNPRSRSARLRVAERI